MWAQVINTLLGLFLMAAPGIFSYQGIAADNDHITGPIVGTFAILALSESTHVAKKFNIPCAIWLMLGPFLLSYPTSMNYVIDMITGAIILGLSFVRIKQTHSLGGGWRALFTKESNN